jgi:FlaA1/EpsC-like NDP-sugar epimerase
MANKRILIIGAGTAGKSLAASLKKNGQPIEGFLDDKSRDKRVVGKLDDANSVIKDRQITDIYFAIPTASAKVVRDFINEIEDSSVKISIIPRSFNIIAKDTVNIGDLTDVDILALIGREPVKHDLLECEDLIRGKTIAVTGAAGSIGSRLVKILAGLNPEKIVCIDWWENGTFFLKQELDGQANLVYRIADIKNPQAIDKIFTTEKPDIVFHAAAYKHVPLMQDNPLEAFNNNVWGSLNMMRQSILHGVKNFVYVSTDKAVNPVNVMGTSKRLGEMLMEVLAASQDTTKFNAVRFGNVIQSNGSVMQIFRQQIDKNLPLTVTHKDVTRYFMTVEEAAQLIIQSTLLGQTGEIFVLDMGEPVRVMDLAKSLNKALRRTKKIKLIGLRPGEKMYEELSYDKKNVRTTPNKKIFIVKGEKAFDHGEFLEKMEEMAAETLAYKLSSPEVIGRMRALGFKIKD